MKPIEIKALRKQLALSQSDTAELLGVSVDAVRKWESGEHKMKALYADKLLQLLSDANRIAEPRPVYTAYSQKEITKNADQLAIETHEAERENANGKFKFIDLFAGVGGVRLGFEAAGGSCVFSSEIDPFAKFTYYTNHGVVPFGDICKIDEADVPKHDVLCAGFPCQPFSHIGKRQGFEHPTQGTMFDEILRIARKRKPKVIFLENVVGLENHDGGNTIKVIVDELDKLQYKVSRKVLDASEFGVPQKRRRIYIVAVRKGVKDFEFPTGDAEIKNVGEILDPNPVGYEISKHLQRTYIYKVKDGRPTEIDESTKGPAKTLVSSYHKIQRLTGTFVKGGETGLRLLSANECKQLMGFDEDFVIPVSRTQMYRQMGNSVVVPVISAIAKEIVEQAL